MDCADYCVDCDGDSDSDGNDLLYGVLIKKKSVLEFDSRTLFFALRAFASSFSLNIFGDSQKNCIFASKK